jgi:hypothetical protein
MTTPTTARVGAIAAACVTVASLLGCGDAPAEPPQPGTVAVILTTPNADDGAILFSIAGGTVQGPAATSPSHRVFSRATGATSTTVVVVGNLAAGPVLLFDVRDVRTVDDFTSTVLEVAARDNSLRASLAGYSLEVRRE